MKKFISNHYLKLCLVTNSYKANSLNNFTEELKIIQQAIGRNKVTSVQYREKEDIPYDIRFIRACEMKKITEKSNIPLIINDDYILSKAIGASGVHLGQSDENPAKVREILGDKFIIGLSIDNYEQLHYANKNYRNIINYVAINGFAKSETKEIKNPYGLVGIEYFRQNSLFPFIPIGGININNIDMIMQVGGVSGVAVVGAIYNSDNPGAAANILRERIDFYHNKEHKNARICR